MPLSDRFRISPSPPLASSAAIVVYERTQRRSVAARQTLGPDVKVVEIRVLDDIWPALAAAPHGVLLIEVESKRAPQIVALLVRGQTEMPQVLPIACVTQASPDWELLLRDASDR